MSTFNTLSSIDVRNHIEKKGNLSYLSWAWAWAEACKVCQPTRTVYKAENGNNYHSDGRTAWVEVGVTIDGIEHIDMLPVMDNRNKSIPVDNINSFDVNKAIQRSTVKALALHGLGLHIYAGEDLPMTLPELSLDRMNKAIEWGINNGKTPEEVIAQAEITATVPDDIKKLIIERMKEANNEG